MYLQKIKYIFPIFLFFIAGHVFALTTVDFCSESGVDGSSQLDNSGTKLSQSFHSSSSQVLDSAKFWLKKFGSPTGNATVSIYAHTGVYGTSSVPTGTALATSDVFDVSTLTTSYQYITFTFSGGNRITLSISDYTVVLNYSTGDASNYILAGNNSTNPCSGNIAYYTGSWTAYSAYDYAFYVYSESSSPTPTSTNCLIASCSYIILADGSFDGLYIIAGIWTFLVVFFGLIFYYRTKIKPI